MSPDTITSPTLPKIRQVKQVLIVEVEDAIREMLVKVMIAEGHEVISASNNYAALTLLQSLDKNNEKFPFDLIILAWTTHKTDDLELCRWLRGQGNLVPMLVLGTNNSETDCIYALEAGADGYLPKPFSTQDLVTRCRTLFRSNCFENRLPKRIVLQFEDLSLYPQEHRVIVRGKEVFLTPKEFRLLELLMSHPGQIWSRQQLFEQIWGLDFTGIAKNLDVHIRRLREKLELRPGRPRYIITVKKLGYRFG